MRRGAGGGAGGWTRGVSRSSARAMPALPPWLWSENWLLLVTRPGEEMTLLAAPIAEACRRGRPPLVALLTDGSGRAPDSEAGAARAAAAERAARRNAAALGLPENRLFLFGLHDGTAPRPGAPLFEPLARALDFLMWSRDCQVLWAPAAAGASGDHAAAASVAAAVAAASGVALWPYALAPQPLSPSEGASPASAARSPPGS
jgi:LmbE family N-acetylglucosaminyl deacetylase